MTILCRIKLRNGLRSIHANRGYTHLNCLFDSRRLRGVLDTLKFTSDRQVDYPGTPVAYTQKKNDY